MPPTPLNAHSANEALSIVGRLHRGILAPNDWEQGLTALAAFVGADRATSYIWNKKRHEATIEDGGVLDAQARLRYSAEFQHIDPARERLRNAEVGAIYVDQLDLGPRMVTDSAFYREYLRPNGIESIMEMVVDDNNGAQWIIGFQRVTGRPLFDLANAIALRALLPHLQTAFRLRIKLRELQHSNAWNLATLNKVGFPLVLLDDQIRVITANTSGRHWMTRPENPINGTQGIDAGLHIAVKRACGHGEDAPLVSAYSFAIQDGSGRHATVLALPMTAPQEDAREMPRPCTLLAGIGVHKDEAQPGVLLKDVFGLTRAEIQLALHLAAGLTLSEVATQTGTSRETIRSQLKAVLRKTGTRRQSELTALLAGLSALNQL